jgi:hypothetical protein
MKILHSSIVVFLLILIACNQNNIINQTNETPIDTISMGVCCSGKDTTLFSFVKKLAPLEIVEASGIVTSHTMPGHFWIHDDGGRGILYLLNKDGLPIGAVTVQGEFGFSDIEDIALFVDPISNKSTIYVADIGDNNAVRDIKTISVYEEPSELQMQQSPSLVLMPKLSIRFRYPDGKRDAETIMVDPLNNDIYIVSKREANVGVYQVKAPFVNSEVRTLKKLGNIPYRLITAGDISSKGDQIILRDYEKAYHWNRLPNETIATALSKDARCMSIIAEEQGEGICFSRNGESFYTVSERSKSPQEFIYQYTKKQ